MLNQHHVNVLFTYTIKRIDGKQFSIFLLEGFLSKLLNSTSILTVNISPAVSWVVIQPYI